MDNKEQDDEDDDAIIFLPSLSPFSTLLARSIEDNFCIASKVASTHQVAFAQCQEIQRRWPPPPWLLPPCLGFFAGAWAAAIELPLLAFFGLAC